MVYSLSVLSEGLQNEIMKTSRKCHLLSVDSIFACRSYEVSIHLLLLGGANLRSNADLASDLSFYITDITSLSLSLSLSLNTHIHTLNTLYYLHTLVS